MSRVEVSENIGPHQSKSIDSATITAEGDVFFSSNYTIHSYQVLLNGSVNGSTDVTFEIQCTNDDGGKEGKYVSDATNWQTIASYTIDNSTNSTGIMYSDVWNFKYSKCKLTITNLGSLNAISVIEKHNA
tara:strand:- start:326 stop:715 length:390 start_codon:yes stop_codon:yes gene_type:complete